MKVYIVDLAGWSLVGAAAVLAAYAGWLFSTKVAQGLAVGVVAWFLSM